MKYSGIFIPWSSRANIFLNSSVWFHRCLCPSIKCTFIFARIPQILNNGTVSVESPVSKANLFVSHFSSCFTRPPPSVSHNPPSPPANEAGLSSVSCSSKKVHKLLNTLKIKTASGPNGFSSHTLRNTAISLSNLFNLSLSSGVVPSEWKLSNVTPVYKFWGPEMCY